jgi:apolipoprotein N-acyltransferase
MVQSSRMGAFWTGFAYFIAAGWSIPVVATNYVGNLSGVVLGTTLWIVGAALLASVWACAWSESRILSARRLPFSGVLMLVPPVGIVAFANPAIGAGYLFPGSGFAGLIMAIALPSGLLVRPSATIRAGAVVSVICALLNLRAPVLSPEGWRAIDTTIAKTPQDTFRSLSMIESHLAQSTSPVLIFPENVVPGWTAATDLFWSRTERTLRAKDRVVLLGATRAIATAGRAQNENRYDNVVMVFGREPQVFKQRIPVPIGMWQPFSGRGVEMNLSGPGAIDVRDHRVAIVICYEQLLMWPWIASALERPSLLVAVANDRWSRMTSIPKYRQAVGVGWSRLLSLPLYSAVNH